VINQQPDVEFDPGELRERQRIQALTDRSARDRDCVDRIGLARLARRIPRPGGQLGSDAHDSLAPGEQEPLERPGDVPAVLKRPDPLARQPARPAQQILKRTTPGAHRVVREHPAGRLLQRRDRVRRLVRVRPDHDHPLRPFSWG